MAKQKRKQTRPFNLRLWIMPAVVTAMVAIPWKYITTDLTWLTSPKFSPIKLKMALLPLPKTDFTAPKISARHIFILDRESKTVLWEMAGKSRVYPASTTKMMTALITMDAFALDQVITVTQSYPAGQVVGFKPQDKITVDQLLYALLIQSGNDAAEILAENYIGGRSAFIEAMNQSSRVGFD